MKTTTLSFLLAISAYAAPLALSAQPLVSTNEFYYIGDAFTMTYADPTGVNAGSSGANVTWDFSTIGSTGGSGVLSIAQDSTAGLLRYNLPDGKRQRIQENNTDTYVLSLIDSAAGIRIEYNNYDVAKRPITYTTQYIDSFRENITATGAFGTGHLTTTGDGWGVLKLPYATFDYVLRVKKEQIEIDTIGAGNYQTTTTISYLWFDTVHHAPLLRMDSVIGIVGSGNKLMYLANPAGVKNMQAGQNSYKCYMHNSDLAVSGTFEYGKKYEVEVYSIIGTKVYNTEFTAAGSSADLDMNKQLSDGIYIVSITCNNDPQTRQVMKVMKQ